MRFNNTDFDFVVNKMRSFFREVKGYKEVHTQNELSILAACEDPQTIATYNYNGALWPLPQTGQMWLENYFKSHSLHSLVTWRLACAWGTQQFSCTLF